MKSLRNKFMAISAITIFAVLTVATAVFLYLFQHNMEIRIHDELKNYVNQVAASVDFNADGSLKQPEGLLNPRFQSAYSGLYWQIDDVEANRQLRSRSLWDYTLPLPDHPHDVTATHKYLLAGPEGNMVIIQERILVVAAPTGSRKIKVAAGMDQSVVTEARSMFFEDMLPYLISLGILLLVAAFVQLIFILRPLGRVVSDLGDIQERKHNRLDGTYPTEILPLTKAVNVLLSSQEKALSRARSRAGDLAHGLKTPLTVLKHNATKLAGLETAEIGDEIVDLVESMEHHIHHELVLSRLAPSPELRQSNADIAKIIRDVTRILQKTPQFESIFWKISLGQQVNIAVDPHDLRELLGNILENACKWTSTQVDIIGVVDQDTYRLSIKDDGPGIEASKIEEMMVRGKRFDEATAGTGIGLSIVRNIADLYSLPIKINNRQTNGLCIIIDLPISSKG